MWSFDEKKLVHLLIQRYVTAGSMDANVLYQHVQLDIDLMQALEAMDRKIAQEREERGRPDPAVGT